MKNHAPAIVASMLLLGLLCGANTALADYTAQGRFVYRDLPYDLFGYTGQTPTLPIRDADVEVVDATTLAVLATGATDQNGEFLINVSESQTRDVFIRVLTIGSQAGDLHFTVRNPLAGNVLYALATNDFTNHGPNTNIDFRTTPVIAEHNAGGDAFNVWDNVLSGFDFVASIDGSRPAQSLSLTVLWALNYNAGTSFYRASDRTIHLLGITSDSDGYDDSIILHEVGHYVAFEVADTDSPGGFHTPNGCFDVRLAWSEAWGTFFQNLVLQFRGVSRPETYVDTTGQPTVGNAFLSYEVESLTNRFGAATGQLGSGNEVSVNAALWDLADGPGDADATPGVDDDALDLANAELLYWDVHKNYLPTISDFEVEDFWNGWFISGHGNTAGMRSVFEARGMRFLPDDQENDDSFDTASNGGEGNANVPYSIYPAGDEDWTRFGLVAGNDYTFETNNVPCGFETQIQLYDSDGTTLLASQGPSGDGSASLNWPASQTGIVFLRVTRPSGAGDYATYDMMASGPLPVSLTDVSLQSREAGIEIIWHAATSGEFSHFEVHRALEVAGPYSPINADAILENPDEPGLFRYLDEDVAAARTYHYRLVGRETSGESFVFGPYSATASAPPRVVLHKVHPNPFNPNTRISYEIPRPMRGSLRVYDVGGRIVRTLVAPTQLSPGRQSVEWDGRDDERRELGSGVYWVRLDAAGVRRIQKAVLVR